MTIRGLNLPGTPRATSACRGISLLFTFTLFLIYKTNIFIKLLKLALFNANMIIYFVIYFCGIWAFSSSRKHLLITLLRLEIVVLVLYFSIYFIWWSTQLRV